MDNNYLVMNRGYNYGTNNWSIQQFSTQPNEFVIGIPSENVDSGEIIHDI